jgi:hypothetical protein
MACKIQGCTETNMNRREALCYKHWNRLPNELKATIRDGAGREQTLRAVPSDEWLRKANEAVRPRTHVQVNPE